MMNRRLCNTFIAANEGIDSWKMCVKKNRYKVIIFLMTGKTPSALEESKQVTIKG